MTLRGGRLFSLEQATKRDLNGSCNQAHAPASHGFLEFVSMGQSHNSQKRRAASAAAISYSPRPRMLPQFPDPASLDLMSGLSSIVQGCVAARLHVFENLPVP